MVRSNRDTQFLTVQLLVYLWVHISITQLYAGIPLREIMKKEKQHRGIMYTWYFLYDAQYQAYFKRWGRILFLCSFSKRNIKSLLRSAGVAYARCSRRRCLAWWLGSSAKDLKPFQQQHWKIGSLFKRSLSSEEIV